MWPFKKTAIAHAPTGPLFFTNTLSGKKEHFIPLKPGYASMYSCGPTVYSRAHLGNLRSQVFADVIARLLSTTGFHVRRVVNITDVDDKIENAAKEQQRSAKELTEQYAGEFLQDIGLLNIDTHDTLFPRATDYVKEQIAMIRELEKKEFTYRISDGIYFDTSKFPDYGKLGGIHEDELKSGNASSLEERVTLAAGRRIAENKEKRHPADFALWKFTPPGARRQLEWPSPWGIGFPGWHIECSAMIRTILGEVIDIHTGGMDLIAIHHNNEIAQSESVSNKQFVRYWIHGAFLNIGNDKISKSLKNDFSLKDLLDRGFHPLTLRYFFLQAHYRSPISFSWEALEASGEALNRLWRLSASVLHEAAASVASGEQAHVLTLLRDDLGTPQALAFLWEILRDEDLSPKAKRGILEAAEPVLGLSLLNPPEQARQFTLTELPIEIQEIVQAREKARGAHDFEKADTLRTKLKNRGYHVDDSPKGPILTLLPKQAANDKMKG